MELFLHVNILRWIAVRILGKPFVSFETGTKAVSFMTVSTPAVVPCFFPSHLLCCFTPRAVLCTFYGASQAGEKRSTSLNFRAHEFSSVGNWTSACSPCGELRWEVQPLDKPAHRAADTLGATPNWVCSWVGIPAQKYELPSKVVIPRSRCVQYQY